MLWFISVRLFVRLFVRSFVSNANYRETNWIFVFLLFLLLLPFLFLFLFFLLLKSMQGIPKSMVSLEPCAGTARPSIRPRWLYFIATSIGRYKRRIHPARINVMWYQPCRGRDPKSVRSVRTKSHPRPGIVVPVRIPNRNINSGTRSMRTWGNDPGYLVNLCRRRRSKKSVSWRVKCRIRYRI